MNRKQIARSCVAVGIPYATVVALLDDHAAPKVVVHGHFSPTDLAEIRKTVRRFQWHAAKELLVTARFKGLFSIVIPDMCYGRVVEIGSFVDRSSPAFGMFMTNPISPAYLRSVRGDPTNFVEYALVRTTNSWRVTAWELPR